MDPGHFIVVKKIDIIHVFTNKKLCNHRYINATKDKFRLEGGLGIGFCH